MSIRNESSDGLSIGLLGRVYAGGAALVLTGAGAIVFDDVVYALIAGFMFGVGAYLFVPWMLSLTKNREAGDDTNVSFTDRIQQNPRASRNGVIGAGIEIGGILVFALGFITDGPDIVLGAGVAISTIVIAYLGASIGVDRVLSE